MSETLPHRQLSVGNYDLTDEEANSRLGAHWDREKVGLSAYNFDQNTHQGANVERFGYDPLPQVNTRDPHAPPSVAEMYPLLLHMDSEEQMMALAKDYERKKAAYKGAYSSDWCQRSAIVPGQNGCSSEDRLLRGNLDDRSGVDDRVQTLLDAAGTVLSNGDQLTP